MADTQPTDVVVDKHICGVCNDEFLTDAEYLAHVCPKTNTTPADPMHLVNSTQPDFLQIQNAALNNGLESLKAEGADTAAQEAAIAQHAADNNLPPAEPTA